MQAREGCGEWENRGNGEQALALSACAKGQVTGTDLQGFVLGGSSLLQDRAASHGSETTTCQLGEAGEGGMLRTPLP